MLRKKICEFFILDSNNDVETHEVKAWKELSENQQKKYKKMWMIFNWNDRYNFFKISISFNITSDFKESQQHYSNVIIINECTARTVKNIIKFWKVKLLSRDMNLRNRRNYQQNRVHYNSLKCLQILKLNDYTNHSEYEDLNQKYDDSETQKDEKN